MVLSYSTKFPFKTYTKTSVDILTTTKIKANSQLQSQFIKFTWRALLPEQTIRFKPIKCI